MIIEEEIYLEHYGTPRRSGRYPWGSGDNDDQSPRNPSFLDTLHDLRKKGLSDADIAKGMGLSSTTELRAQTTIANNAKKQAQITMAERLKAKGLSNGAIAERMNLPGESSVRALLAPGAKEKAYAIKNVADMLKKEVDTNKYIDIGSGVENHIHISPERLRVAVTMLQNEGYNVHPVNDPQIGTAFETRRKVLVPPGVTQREAWENRLQIKQISAISDDNGHTFSGIHDPISVNPNRVSIKYKEEGGAEADGVIFVRPGIKDISLGKNKYAQVRVQVGDGHYLKGMAMYKDDLPPGTDLLFNTNKSRTGNKFDAMKPLKEDRDYPFGAIVRQITADTGTPNEHVTSAMNLVQEQGDWGKWSKTLSSQFLSKQPPSLAKAQLNKTYERRKKEFDEINKLTNPAVKKKLLESFADDADSAAVHLKAATIPRSAWHAILPIQSIKQTEIYAPNYDDGTNVALVRYPHGGRFEIPELVVNNKNREARKLLGQGASDAVGIHHSVAERLSGADFDGDTVLVIPNNSRRFKSSPALEGLKNFDPRAQYPGYEGMPKINKQQEMGNISNLITDMTLKAAPDRDIVKAVRHSMVVIDAENHNLNWKQSALDNGIRKLKADYQGGPRAGASTLISKKKQTMPVPDRKLRRQSKGGPVDPVTGRKVYEETGKTRRTKDGTRIPKTVKVNKLAETDDAFTILSGTPTPMERLYAEHSNRLKGLANEARLAALNTPKLKYSDSANKVYAKEVASLDSKLALIQMKRPRERQAQTIAAAVIKAKFDANPNLEKDSRDKIRFKELETARARMGVKKVEIKIEPEEWNAIQAGAISDNKLTQILSKSNMEVVRKFATPRKEKLMSPVQTRRAASMLKSGATRAEVARALGVSLSTLDLATNE